MKLFIPGPVTVREDVLQKMATPMIAHRSKDASALQESISKKMQKIWNTENEVILSTSSGSGLMEAAIRCCTKKKAACFSVGDFGTKWYKMGTANGVAADLFEVTGGLPNTPEQVDEVLATGEYDLVTVTHNETTAGITNPIAEIGEVVKKYLDVIFCIDTVSSAGGDLFEIDQWGVDIAVTSTQKCLGLPPGLAACTLSERALERAKTVENRGSYLDLVKLHDFIVKKPYQYPTTPSLSHMFALDYQLDYILDTEGLDNRIARHKEMADVVRAWAKKYFGLYVKDETYASNTVSCIENTRNINVGELINTLKQEGMLIGNGYGDLKDKTFRIAHMADTSVQDIQELLSRIEEILSLNE